MEFGILGPLELEDDGRSVALPAAKHRALLAILLLHANELVSSDRLIEELWAGQPPPSARKTLQTYVSKLRQVLGGAALVTRPAGYELRVEPGRLDLHRFERLVAESREAAPREAAAKLRDALALWRGPALADIAYEPFAQAEIARLEELRLSALEERIEADLALGRHRELAGELEALITEEPLRERLRGQLMLALYRSGRQAEALDAYRRARQTLVEELGIEPSPALQQLERRILAQDPELDFTPLEPEPAPPGRERPAPTRRTPTTSFVGRRKELRELKGLLSRDGVRLLTLTGAGGSGKTRLALEATGGLDATVIELASIGDPRLVATTIASALGLRESPGRGAAEALAVFLRQRQTLLVLDNFEQVLEAGSLLADLLDAAPGLKLVVTSRAPLRLAAEQLYLVPPLELPAREARPERLRRAEAVQLFVERAQTARADFELTAFNADAVAELCVRLDGLPLALELAAARIRVLSPRAIVARLGRRLDLLKAESPDAPARHRTLRAAIDWSYELLSAQEQSLFASLGAFVGGFTLDGAEAAAGEIGLDVIDGVESLLASSLVRAERTAADEPRFGMLETIREYALERLAEREDAAEIGRRHARFYLGLAEEAEPELRGPHQVSWLERLDAEHDNLRAALESATERGEAETGLRIGAALWRFWQVRGLLGEGRERLERLLALEAPDTPAAVRAHGLACTGRLAFMQGDYDSARRYIEESLPVERELGDGTALTMCLTLLGMIAQVQGEAEAASRLLEQAVRAARTSRDWWAQSQALRGLGELVRAAGDPRRARLVYEECLRAAREVGDWRGIALTLVNLGLISLALHEHDRAQALFEEALPVYKELGDTWGLSRTFGHLGVIAQRRGDHAAARRLFGEALTIQAETDDRPGIGSTLELLASLAAAEGRPRRATRLYAAADLLREATPAHPMGSSQGGEVDVAALRAALGEEAFAEAWSKGRSLLLHELIAYALEEEPAELEPAIPAAAADA